MSGALDARERERLSVQKALDRQKSASERNRLGQFATPTPLALDMANLGAELLGRRGGVEFLDPALGSGVFFCAARKALGAARLRSAIGFENDPAVAAEAERLWGEFGLKVRVQDFCTARPAEEEKATLVICNPPYVRHHHLDSTRKLSLRRELDDAGFQLSGLAGLYCSFLLLAHRWLAPGGVGVWLVPAEFLDVNYGRALKEYLTTRVTLQRMHRFSPENAQFTDALVSSVVLAFVNAPPLPGQRVELNIGSRLLEPQFSQEVALADLDPAGKWGPLFGGPREARVASPDTLTVGDLFAVKRGLATGANDYFILARQRARELELPEQFLRPILPSPRCISGQRIDRAPDGFPIGLPELVLLDCDLPVEKVQQQHPALARYLQKGEDQDIPRRYIPAHRSPWYKQERRPPAPILCTYMGRKKGGRALRFIRNCSDATAPNVYLLLYPRPDLAVICGSDPEIIDDLFTALSEIADELSRSGRVYGGGLNKIEPRELAVMVLPTWARKRYGHLRVRAVQLDLLSRREEGE